MVGHGGSSAGLYLADPTSPIPSHCAVIAVLDLGFDQGGGIPHQAEKVGEFGN